MRGLHLGRPARLTPFGHIVSLMSSRTNRGFADAAAEYLRPRPSATRACCMAARLRILSAVRLALQSFVASWAEARRLPTSAAKAERIP